METDMIHIESFIIAFAILACVFFTVITVIDTIRDLFFGYRDDLSADERLLRSQRRGQVRRAAKKAGMSFREYSIRHFS